ncbi:MAG: PHP domain-containing protein [Dehalococcoidia bacterium]|nr:PHP domain-containing protein [Dehalococcoidia bacterium]
MDRARIMAYVEAARARGVTHVAFTEHLFRFREAFELLYGWWDDDPDPALAKLACAYWQDHVSGSVADYVREVEAAKRDGLPVLLGLEMDWIHGRADDLARFLAPYDWDIVLGSVHYIGSFGFDDERFRAEWDRRQTSTVWHDYGVLVGELAASGLADVLSHPDLPKVFGHRPQSETPLHDAILTGASGAGTAIELNSNGLRKCGEIYPALPLLQRAHDLGLPVTLASDAHTPARVGEDFAALAAWARRAGYASATSFVQREPQTYALPADAP